MTKTLATLAKQMEREMQRAGKDCALYANEHCAIYEKDLKCICPRKDKDRKKKLVHFAERYGFRLKLYREGLFAIFGRGTCPTAIHTGVLWPGDTKKLPANLRDSNQ